VRVDTVRLSVFCVDEIILLAFHVCHDKHNFETKDQPRL